MIEVAMSTKELGRTGVQIPEIGLGTWDYHGGVRPLRAGLEAGALYIDTAESYGTEAVVARVIRDCRRRVFVATKVSPQNFRPADFRKSLDRSLQTLGLDRIDLYQLHEPNPAIPIEDTMGTVAQAIDEGKVRFAGVSNFDAAQLQAAQAALGRHPVVSNQVRYNLIDRYIETGVLPYCRQHKITVIAYSPLARGVAKILECDPTGAFARIARETGRSLAQIALNWCLCKQGVVAIPKGNTEAHVIENCGAGGWRLTPEQEQLLDTAIQFRRRGQVDRWLRLYTPQPIRKAILGARRYLPRSVRRFV